MYTSTMQEIKDAEGNTWKIWVDNEGLVNVEAPCGTYSSFRTGKKGKLFSDFLNAYKKAAKHLDIWDTIHECKVEQEVG